MKFRVRPVPPASAGTPALMLARPLCLAALLLPLATTLPAADRYQITLRLPPGGLYAREEAQIEFRVEDTTRPDPLGGFAPVVRAAPDAVIDMPSMPGMPQFTETAHPEGVPGDYGIHPAFAHGGDYRLRLTVHPPNADPFTRDFPLTVQDTDPKRKPAPPRYTLELTTDPKRPKAGDPVDLRITIHDRDTAAPVTSYDIAHERPMHLVIVRRNLAHFAHEHPQQDGAAFHLRTTFPSGGDFRLFADVAPRGAGAQILTAKLKIAGPETPDPAPPTTDATLETPGPFSARKTVAIDFHTDSRGLEPYLGAAAHLILIHEDAETFVHSHPTADTAPDGAFRFLARLPKPGAYRGWLQFQRAGRILTFPFQVRARE